MAAIVGTAVYPPVGILFALIMAFMRRWDRVVMFTLVGVAALGVLWLSLFLGVSGGGVGSGGGAVAPSLRGGLIEVAVDAVDCACVASHAVARV